MKAKDPPPEAFLERANHLERLRRRATKIVDEDLVNSLAALESEEGGYDPADPESIPPLNRSVPVL